MRAAPTNGPPVGLVRQETLVASIRRHSNQTHQASLNAFNFRLAGLYALLLFVFGPLAAQGADLYNAQIVPVKEPD